MICIFASFEVSMLRIHTFRNCLKILCFIFVNNDCKTYTIGLTKCRVKSVLVFNFVINDERRAKVEFADAPERKT